LNSKTDEIENIYLKLFIQNKSKLINGMKN